MESKEVLEYLRTCKFCKIVMGTDYENDDRYFNIYDVFREEIEIIQKDLDRLEELEKENERLKKDLEKYTHKEECAYVLKNTLGDICFFIDNKNSIVACYKTLEEAKKSVNLICELHNCSSSYFGIDYVPVSKFKKWEYDTRFESEE